MVQNKFVKNNDVLVLELSQLTGTAREVCSTAVQERLFKLGYGWAAIGKKVEFTNEAYIIINNEELYDWNNISYSTGGSYLLSLGDRKVMYNCVYEMDAFLCAAEKIVNVHKTIEAVIEGVNVRITKDGISWDNADQFKRVLAKAKDLQVSHFGKS